jgi:Protein of unknown function (DUF3631)
MDNALDPESETAEREFASDVLPNEAGAEDAIVLPVPDDAPRAPASHDRAPARRPLCGMEQLAVRPHAPVLICEGEKSCNAARLIFADHVVVISPGGLGEADKADWTPIAQRKVTIWPDYDHPGTTYASSVASILTSLRCEVDIIDVAALIEINRDARSAEFNADGWDAADVVEEWSDLAKLRSIVSNLARPHVVPADAAPIDEAALERRLVELAKLSEVKYALARATAAKEFRVPVSLFDKLVKAKRPNEDTGQGRAVAFPDVEPWPSPVDGAELLDELARAVLSYVKLTPTQADALTLWACFSHVHDAFDVSPRLVVTSPQKRSGKTTLFSVLHRIVAKPRAASGITSSALLRLIERHQPTMLIDEMDAIMKGDKEMAQALRGLMNSGFNRTFATHTMNIPSRESGYEPREFSTWCPLALAGIGHLPDTVRDRSIEILMQRKLAHEKVKRLRRRDGADLNELARKLARFGTDNIEALTRVRPEMPDGLNDSAADAWEPLSAIADLVRGDWPERARAAAVTLSGGHLAKDSDSDTLLLGDVRDAFDHFAADRLSSDRLVNHLVRVEGRPWSEWRLGKPMSKWQLSNKLGQYRIVSGTIRTGNKTPKG